jgi:hypothetical protein
MEIKENDEEKVSLKINNNGFYREADNFIKLGNSIEFLGDRISLGKDSSRSILTSNKFEFENS